MKTTHLAFGFLALALLGRLPAIAADADNLTLAQARALALKMHPSITEAELRALAAKEAITEAKAGFYPQISGNATAVGTGENTTRLAAGGLSNSQIFDRVGVGATVSLLLTDFGRTSNLASAAKYNSHAAETKIATTRAQLLLGLDTAFYSALEARKLKEVAAKTLADRQQLLDQTTEYAKNQLKSDLDVRFAAVAVSEAKLLADSAEESWQSALATLTDLLGQRELVTAGLLEETSALPDLPSDPAPLIELALKQRPELDQRRAERDAALATARAAADAQLPTVNALASVGLVPVRSSHFEDDYAAAGVNVNLPLFAGGYYEAKQHEAELQASAANADLHVLENDVTRDVRLAWLESSHAHERIALTASLLDNANAAYDLAQARFNGGLSSTVELTQAELAQVSAQIAHATAEYEYRVRRDILDFQTGNLH